jgi:TP901 family phage tail tape measure protein
VRGIGARLAGVSGAVAAGFGLSTRVFAGFDDRMRVVRAVTGATQEQFEALTDEAKRLGRTTSFTAGQVAEAMTELGRAGFDPTAILQSTEAVLALARATSTDLPRATEIAGAALRGFNLPASEMGRVSDVLTATANKSAQTLEDLFEAFKPVAPIAAEAGESMEDVAAAIGILANNGIKGSLAGNALARAYKNLSSSAAQDELRRFGVEAIDASGNLRPLADIINDLAKATQGLGTAERLAIFETLFGRGQAAALKLASSGTAFDTLRDEIRDAAGIAVETAEQMDAGIGGAFRKLLSAVEGIAIAIGEAIEGPVRKVADVLAIFAGSITRLVNQNRELVATIAKITAIVLGVGVALVIAGTAIVGVGAVLGSLAAIASAAGTAVGIIGTVLGAMVSPIGLVIAGVAALGVAILYYTGAGGEAIAWLSKRFSELRAFVGKVAGASPTRSRRATSSSPPRSSGSGLQVAWKRGVAALNGVWLGLATSSSPLLRRCGTARSPSPRPCSTPSRSRGSRRPRSCRRPGRGSRAGSRRSGSRRPRSSPSGCSRSRGCSTTGSTWKPRSARWTSSSTRSCRKSMRTRSGTSPAVSRAASASAKMLQNSTRPRSQRSAGGSKRPRTR